MPEASDDRRIRLLLVDDDEMVLRALARSLRQDFDLTTASCAAEALRHLASDGAYDIILSDVTMPEVDGVELARRALLIRPELAGRIVLMTGGLPEREAAAVEGSGFPVIGKPIDDLAMLRAVLRAAAGLNG